MQQNTPFTAEQRAAVEKHNAPRFFMDGLTFYIANLFMDVTMVISLFIASYTGSLVLAGMAGTLKMTLQVIGQLSLGPYVGRFPDHGKLVRRVALLCRWLPLAGALLVLTPLPKPTVAVLYLGLFGLFFLIDGAIIIPWTDLFSRTMSPQARTRILSRQTITLGFIAMGCSMLIKALMDSPVLTEQYRYAILLGIAGVIFFINGLILCNLKDIPHTAKPKSREGLLSALMHIPTLWREQKQYRTVLITRILWMFFTSAVSLAMLFIHQLGALSETQFSSLAIVNTAGMLLAGLLLGALSKRGGNRLSSMILYGAGILFGVCGLLLPILQGTVLVYPLCIFMMLICGFGNSGWIAPHNYMLDVLPASSRPTALLTLNILGFPFAFLPLLLSSMAENIGFNAVHLLVLIACALSVLVATLFLKPGQIAPYLMNLGEAPEHTDAQVPST